MECWVYRSFYLIIREYSKDQVWLLLLGYLKNNYGSRVDMKSLEIQNFINV